MNHIPNQASSLLKYSESNFRILWVLYNWCISLFVMHKSRHIQWNRFSNIHRKLWWEIGLVLDISLCNSLSNSTQQLPSHKLFNLPFIQFHPQKPFNTFEYNCTECFNRVDEMTWVIANIRANPNAFGARYWLCVDSVSYVNCIHWTFFFGCTPFLSFVSFRPKYRWSVDGGLCAAR